MKYKESSGEVSETLRESYSTIKKSSNKSNCQRGKSSIERNHYRGKYFNLTYITKMKYSKMMLK